MAPIVEGQKNSQSNDPLIGQTLAGRYRLHRLLGEGGMGKVYLAEDLKLPRQVAIKMIRPDLVKNNEVRKRIGRECRMHAAIGVHPNIIALHDKIEEDGNIFLIMEYVDGITLAGWLGSRTSSETRLTLGNIIGIIYQLLQALSRIHNNDIIHRDIKPSNIIIQKQSNGEYRAKLMDFGIARLETVDDTLTQLTTLDAGGPGTPAYMAPERIDSQTFGEISPATDLYAVGIILFELLSDGPPFKGTLTEVFTGHLTKPPDLATLNDNLPSDLRKIIEKSLCKQQEDRYQDALVFAHDLIITVEGDTLRSMTIARSAVVDVERTVLATGNAVTNNLSDSTLLDSKTGGFTKNQKMKGWVLSAVPVVIILIIGGYWGAQKYFSKNEAVSVKPVPVEISKESTLSDSDSNDNYSGPANTDKNTIKENQHPLDQASSEQTYELQPIKPPALSAHDPGGTKVVSKISSEPEESETYNALEALNRKRREIKNDDTLKTGNNTAEVEQGPYILKGPDKPSESDFFQTQKQATSNLTIIPNPAGAQVRILNIKPRYQPGMELKPGFYQVEVSKENYQPVTRWLEVQAGQNLNREISLQPLQKPLQREEYVNKTPDRPEVKTKNRREIDQFRDDMKGIWKGLGGAFRGLANEVIGGGVGSESDDRPSN